MKFFPLVGLMLAIAPLPALAQDAAPPAPPPASVSPNPQLRAAMEQSHAQLRQLHLQARARMLAALSPLHRTALANTVGQLALAPNPNLQAAAAQLDAIFTPAEKQSIVAIDAAVRTNARAIMQQQRAAFEAAMPADRRAESTSRDAQMQAYRASRPRAARVPDPGAIALRTLGSIGGGMGWPHHGGPGA